MKPLLNVLGTSLKACCYEPMTGYYRDGFCRSEKEDLGRHTVCALMSDAFLKFSKKMGNDLSTARPHFPGLKAGDYWCVCVMRWKEAHEAGAAPKVKLEACSESVLEIVPLAILSEYAI
jgi:hypothetical protein